MSLKSCFWFLGFRIWISVFLGWSGFRPDFCRSGVSPVSGEWSFSMMVRCEKSVCIGKVSSEANKKLRKRERSGV